jgi:hypothetical protein
MRYLPTLLSFGLACASSVIVARAQSQTTPGPEVKKLAVMVGKFTVEDEVKAGEMGPNSPATKFSGTEDCGWTAGGFAVICEAALHGPGRKYSGLPSSTTIRPPRHTDTTQSTVQEGRKQDWHGERRRMDLAWGEQFWGEDVSHPVHHEGCFADSYEYTEESGESENSMKVFVSGRETRVAATKPATSKPGQ